MRERRDLGVEGPPAAAPKPAGVTEASGGFSVRLQGATLFDLIQFECLERSRRIVRLRDGARLGYLYFRDGNVVHAVDGVLTGHAAFRSLLRWPRGSFESWDGPWPAQETIITPSQTLLLAIAQEHDERKGDAPNILSFPTKEAAEPAMNPTPSSPPPQHTLLRISSEGVAAVHGTNSGETQQLAEVAAYAAQMADLVGDLLLGSGFDVMEVALASGNCAIARQPNGDLLAARGGQSSDPAALRAAVEPGRGRR